VYGTVIGLGVNWMVAFTVSQMQVQRYLCLPTLREAKKACITTMFGMATLTLMVGWLGLTLYTTYVNCDPITAKQVKTKDQLLPFLVLHVAGDIPGLPGLFMAGVFSGSLSTISSGLNALAAIALKDFTPSRILGKMGEYQQALLTKLFSFIFGVACFGITYLIRYMPGLLEAAMVVGGVVNGPIIGIFTVGMLLPWVNSRGATLGFMGSVLVTTWVAVGGNVYKRFNPYTSQTSLSVPNSTVGCPATWMDGWEPSPTVPPHPLPGHLDIYDISYVWYSLVGALLVILFSLLYTWTVSSQDLTQLPPSLMAPILPTLLSYLPPSLRGWWGLGGGYKILSQEEE